MRGGRYTVVLGTSILALTLAPAPAALSASLTINVNTTADRSLAEDPEACGGPGPGGSECPLRAALEEASKQTGLTVDEGIVVSVPAGEYRLLGPRGPLPLGDPNFGSCGGGFSVRCPVTLRGAGPGQTIIDGQHATRLLAAVEESGALAVERVTLARGGSSTALDGGATLRYSTVAANTAGVTGGGIGAESPATG